MADVEVIIKIPEEDWRFLKESDGCRWSREIIEGVINGTPLTPDVLADMLMEERIRGELKQDISYSKDVIDDVRCRLTVDIIDHRPCYCGAELKKVWRESEDKE